MKMKMTQNVCETINEVFESLNDAESRAVLDDLLNAVLRTAEQLAVQSEKVVYGFYEEEHPLFAQGSKGIHELSSEVTAEECKGYIEKIKALEKQVLDLQSSKGGA